MRNGLDTEEWRLTIAPFEVQGKDKDDSSSKFFKVDCNSFGHLTHQCGESWALINELDPGPTEDPSGLCRFQAWIGKGNNRSPLVGALDTACTSRDYYGIITTPMLPHTCYNNMVFMSNRPHRPRRSSRWLELKNLLNGLDQLPGGVIRDNC